MAWYGWLILTAVVAATGTLWYLVNRDKGGPSHCMGCGKCDRTGVCVLNGKPVGKGGRAAEFPVDNLCKKDIIKLP